MQKSSCGSHAGLAIVGRILSRKFLHSFFANLLIHIYYKKTQHVLNQVSAPLEDDMLQDLIQATFAYKYIFMINEGDTSNFTL
ncbi:hypothetical protein BRARA_H00509 [Brassica rapa]|uniref:Uncharacterized protein n=1 Tax=Brassica campestris TaxID=3711 RepID=A0A397YFF9_BRACM|nr:hypothetical protein BRARA_H00509 [Brassica rapa]